MTNQTIVFGQKPGETEAQAQARIKAELAQLETTLEKKAALLKKWGMG